MSLLVGRIYVSSIPINVGGGSIFLDALFFIACNIPLVIGSSLFSMNLIGVRDDAAIKLPQGEMLS